MNFSYKDIFEKKYFPIILIFFFTLILYSPSIKIPFVNDEISFIQRNQPANISELFGLFNKKDYDGYYYRPIGNFVSGLSTLVFNYDYVYYRILNILLHAAAGILLYYFLYYLLSDNNKRRAIAMFAALFFIAFPLNDYVIFWQTDLFDRLMLIFYLAGLLSFIKQKLKPGFLSLLFFLLSMMSKEMAFSFPLIIFLITYFFTNDSKKIYKSILTSLPYVALMGIFILLRIIIFNNDVFTAKDAHSSGTLIDIIKNYSLFSGLLVFPFFIREIQYFFLSHKLLTAILLLPIAIPVIYFLFKRIQRELLLLFFILFIVLTIAPASRLFLRWYLYLPEVGFAAFLSYLVFMSKFNSYKLSYILAAAILLIYSSSLALKEKSWVINTESSVSLLKDCINKSRDEIVKSGEVNFLTVPAKVDDIPIFQLGFDKLFNFYGGFKKPVTVNLYSKSYLASLSDSISSFVQGNNLVLSQIEDNYFILFNNGKNLNFESNNFMNENRSRLTIEMTELKNKVLFTFSKGKFIRFKESQ